MDGSAPDLAASGDLAPARAPLHHRADASQCLGPAPAGSCNFNGGGPGMCKADSDCTMGSNGRCVENNGGAIFCMCSYDTCTTDASCGAGKLCACHGSQYMNGGNSCYPGNCRVDTDCLGGRGYCSPSANPMGCGGLGGYYCHTPADTCIDDTDCTNSMNGPQQCTFSTSDSRWECTPQLLCA